MVDDNDSTRNPAQPRLNGHEPGTRSYNELRDALIWNARLARSRAPAMIARPGSTSEVAAWIGWAAAQGIRVALRGSGHNYQAAALRAGSLLIDLGGLDRIEVDAAAKRATVGAGVTGGRLVRALAQYGLAFPIGHCADVALSGFILSGGIGWNYGAWGASCASVAAMEMVTAQGEILHVDPRRAPELMWAAKGAGCGFFAAVTGYEIDLYRAPPCVIATNMVFAALDAERVAAWLETAARMAHPSVEIICMVGPDLDAGAPSITIRAVACCKDEAEGRARMGRFLTPPEDAQWIAQPVTKSLAFSELPQFSAMPSGKRVAADQIWSDAGPADLLRAVNHLAGVPDKSSAISITALGGGATTPGTHDGSAGALSRIGATAAGIYAMWDEAGDDARHLDWVKAGDAALAPFRTGRYVGEADLFAAPKRIEDCFSGEALAQLRALRARYDPEGLFHS